MIIGSREKAIAFFVEHAGCSYDPKTETEEQGRIRGAEKLTDAEAYASEKGWVVRWDYDQDGCIGCDCGSDECACATGTEHECLCAVLYSEPKGGMRDVLQSLGSICEPTPEYRRVIEAELALEAMPNE